MKKIENYGAAKYKAWKYKKIKDGIYKTKADGEKIYVTSLSFLQEPELNEGDNAGNISQYPLEDIQALRSIIGKHVYNKEVGEDVELIIE